LGRLRGSSHDLGARDREIINGVGCLDTIEKEFSPNALEAYVGLIGRGFFGFDGMHDHAGVMFVIAEEQSVGGIIGNRAERVLSRGKGCIAGHKVERQGDNNFATSLSLSGGSEPETPINASKLLASKLIARIFFIFSPRNVWVTLLICAESELLPVKSGHKHSFQQSSSKRIHQLRCVFGGKVTGGCQENLAGGSRGEQPSGAIVHLYV